jgi:uncharacterized protein YbjT (DUF2867 family)
LTVIQHEHFLDYNSLSEVFKNQDGCIWCLGISQTRVSKEQYRIITYDYAIAAATAMLKANSAITFLFLSGAGADSKEKSRTLFARVKGQTENALLKLPFKKIFIARPAGIKPRHVKASAPWYEKGLFHLYPLFKLLIPSLVITTEELAKALLKIAKEGAETTIVESGALKQLLKR